MNNTNTITVGTKLKAVDGFEDRFGWVTDIITDRWGTHFEVLMDDGEVKICESVTNVGIGWHFV